MAIWIAGIILAPFTEDIFFRGFLFRAIAMRKGLLRGIVYSSVIFGIVHLNRRRCCPSPPALRSWPSPTTAATTCGCPSSPTLSTTCSRSCS